MSSEPTHPRERRGRALPLDGFVAAGADADRGDSGADHGFQGEHVVAGVARQLIERAKTSTGLSVTVDILEKTYATGRQCAEDFKNTMKILFDACLAKWNYRAHPESG
jgi:hypothetical protein